MSLPNSASMQGFQVLTPEMLRYRNFVSVWRKNLALNMTFFVVVVYMLWTRQPWLLFRCSPISSCNLRQRWMFSKDSVDIWLFIFCPGCQQRLAEFPAVQLFTMGPSFPVAREQSIFWALPSPFAWSLALWITFVCGTAFEASAGLLPLPKLISCLRELCVGHPSKCTNY